MENPNKKIEPIKVIFCGAPDSVLTNNETKSLRVEHLAHADRFIVPSVFDK